MASLSCNTYSRSDLSRFIPAPSHSFWQGPLVSWLGSRSPHGLHRMLSWTIYALPQLLRLVLWYYRLTAVVPHGWFSDNSVLCSARFDGITSKQWPSPRFSNLTQSRNGCLVTGSLLRPHKTDPNVTDEWAGLLSPRKRCDAGTYYVWP